TRVSLLLLRLLRAVTRAVIIRLSWCLIRSSIRRHRSVRGSDRKPTISIIRLWLDLWSILSADIDGGDFMTEQLTAQELQKLHKGLGEIDREIARKSPVSDAIGGALMGVAIGFLAHRKDKGHRELLAHAGWGAAIAFGLGYLSRGGMSLISGYGHELEKTRSRGALSGEPRVPVPLTPVVTQGYFAGAPRPLYHAGDDVRVSDVRAGHYVGGAVPPGGDYSFTRRPGFNGKDY